MEQAAETILIVEDDPEIRDMVSELMVREGWCVLSAGDATEMDRLLATDTADLVLLDINLLGEDGLSICKRLSNDSDIAILMLTARHEDIDRIIGLEVGADDYLGKPFNPRELIARIRALLRRQAKTKRSMSNSIIIFADHRIDPDARIFSRSNGEEIALSGAEFELLFALAEARGRILSREYLLDRIHGRAAHPFDRSIDVLVSRLRKKIDKDARSLIESVRNVGYVLRTPN